MERGKGTCDAGLFRQDAATSKVISDFLKLTYTDMKTLKSILAALAMTATAIIRHFMQIS